MRLICNPQENSPLVLAIAQETRLAAQQLRWEAIQMRCKAELLGLSLQMREANRLTLVVTAALLQQRGLLSLSVPTPRHRRAPQPPSLVRPRSELSSASPLTKA